MVSGLNEGKTLKENTLPVGVTTWENTRMVENQIEKDSGQISIDRVEVEGPQTVIKQTQKISG